MITGAWRAKAVGLASLVVLLIGWLWPIGAGGAMPVGGDVTQFQVGLMAVLGGALRDGRLPFWNDRWGFGFPGLAESQMGVYYPPHLLLYGLLAVEAAYTASMVLHVLWGGLGARWAARRFGASEWGGVLAGLSWSASGFFLIHLPHQWAYTVGSWTPWAWGLAWSILSGKGGRLAPWLLAAVLTVQILPGHFQLAFCTQVSLIAMVAGVVAFAKGERRAAAGRSIAVLICLAAAFPMAACQVVPTLRLAQLAETQRTFEYLSGFAASPLHLVNLVAPELFHRSPLWRPVAWDPFHTAPEELRLYVGLVPLFLAVGAIARPGPGGRAAVRVLLVVLVAGMLLSLGPYAPGFGVYSRWPGFSYFRAPSRWGMVATLALAILAGLGLDAIRDGRWRRPGPWLLAFAMGAATCVTAVLGVFESGLRTFDGPGRSDAVDVAEGVFALRPWDDGITVSGVIAQARRPQEDLRVIAAQAREGLGPVPAIGLRLDRERWRIYRAELGTTAALLVLAVLLAPLAGRRRAFVAGLVALTIVDLGLLARRRPVDLAPIRPLTEQSAVLGRLDAMPEGTRSIDPMRNLPMVAGASPVQSYRTLDLPILDELRIRADLIPADPDEAVAILDAQRALGARVRILGPIGAGTDALIDRFGATGLPIAAEVVDDPALTGWLFNARYAATPTGRDGRYVVLDAGPAPRAWLVPTARPDAVARLRSSRGDPGDIRSILAGARPITLEATTPEHLELAVEAEGPAVVVVSQLDYPEWQASWVGPDGRANPSGIDRVLGGWQGVRVPGPGRWTLRLDYAARAETWGLVVSALAWAGWGAGLLRARRRSPEASSPTVVQEAGRRLESTDPLPPAF